MATAKPKKHPIADLDDASPPAKRARTTPGDKKPVGRKRILQPMETDVAFEGLVADQADTLRNETRYLGTQPVLPDTPASINTTDLSRDYGADFAMDTNVLNPCERTGSVASIFEPSFPTKKQTRKETSAITVEKNNIRLKNSNDCSDGFVIEPDSGNKLPKSTHKCPVNVKSEVDVAKEPSATKEKETSTVSLEKVKQVDKILNRRLVVRVIGGIPRQEHYEYLVSFVGLPPTENSWEPYHKLSGTVELTEFLKRLALKSMIRAFLFAPFFMFAFLSELFPRRHVSFRTFIELVPFFLS